VPKLTVTLVHGTHARGAPWTQAGSPLWRELEGHFGSAAVIDRFDWSGDNTVFARRDAGSELVAHMNSLKQRFPTAKQYIVGHSHGGNVALYAAEEIRVDGIACLATPFLHASPRDEALSGEKAVRRGLFGVACFTTYIAYLIIDFGWLTSLLLLLFNVFISGAIAAIMSPLMTAAATNSPRLAELITATVPRNTCFSIFRVTGDEASLSLATGQLIAWAATKLYADSARAKPFKFLANPFKKKRIPRGFWYILLVSVLAFMIGMWTSQNGLTAGAVAVLLIGKIGIVMSLLLYGWTKTTLFDNFLYGVSFFLLWVATIIGNFLIGMAPPRDVIKNNFARWILGFGSLVAVDVYTEATPPGGPWTVYHFGSLPDQNFDGDRGLAHSVYNHPEVRTRLVEWLALCATAQHAGPEY
jgi:hypothetical protein